MSSIILRTLVFSAVFPAAATPQTYTTNFPLAENPVSENGHWINGGTAGQDWTNVSTANGRAIGHESGTVNYTDATALLTGTWGPDQSASAKVYSINQNDACYQEVELRLRSSLSAHNCSGYEISMKCSKTSGAYLIIVRWNGRLGDFTILTQLNGASYGVANGDTVKATITGNVIAAYINGVKKAEATDDTYASGYPGMGFNLYGCTGNNADYGYTWFSATGNAGNTQSAPEGGTPSRFFLGQNYPNPFNPSTAITFQLPERGTVSLKVFDTVGRDVATLVSGTMQAGEHTARFDAKDLASGIYFYRLTAGDGSRTRKMLLLR
jgi:hypothetical protein